jgi:hypothetical protein
MPVFIATARVGTAEAEADEELAGNSERSSAGDSATAESADWLIKVHEADGLEPPETAVSPDAFVNLISISLPSIRSPASVRSERSAAPDTSLGPASSPMPSAKASTPG